MFGNNDMGFNYLCVTHLLKLYKPLHVNYIVVG